MAIIKPNYEAWHVKASDFPHNSSADDKLAFLTRYGVLAPSGHNTQPWSFDIKNGCLTVHVDRRRLLPYSGIQANEPYVSIGACLAAMQIAAKGFGYMLNITYATDDSNTAARVGLGKSVMEDAGLLDALVRRTSNRHPYATEALPEDVVASFAAPDLATFSDVSLRQLSAREDIAFIAEQTNQATLSIFGDPKFRQELSKWVRNNITKQHDGMPGYTQGIPGPVSLFARHIIGRLDISKDQAKKDRERIIHSANLCIVAVNPKNPIALMNAGRLYTQICVYATKQHVASTGLGAAIIDPATRQAIVERYKLQGEPVAIIRLGKTQRDAPHTPRWPAAALLYKD